MLSKERQNRIKEMMKKDGYVKNNDLSLLFNVSTETIRRDLTQLEKEGLIQKNYGGAVLRNVQSVPEEEMLPPVQQRRYHFSKEKNAIGMKAAELVKDEQIIIVDAGSTTWYATKHLREIKNLVVITNALDIAEESGKNDSTSVYLLGGKLMKNSNSLIGPQAENEVKNYNADLVFLGTSGITNNHGFSSADLYESQVKRAMVSAGRKTIILADHKKLKQAGLVEFCPFEEVDILVTSDLADKVLIDEFVAKGIEVIVAPIKNQNVPE